MRTCPHCHENSVIEDGYCVRCRQCTLQPEATLLAESGSPSSDWVAEAEAALANAIKARDGAREAKEWNALVALEKAVKALDAAPHLKRPPSATDPGELVADAGAALVPETEREEMPMCECGWCGQTSPMRVDAELHPLDLCPHCETEGFMSMLEGGDRNSDSELQRSATRPTPKTSRGPCFSHTMKKTRYPNTMKIGITPAQAKWIKREAKTRSEAQVVREAIDAARKRPTVTV